MSQRHPDLRGLGGKIYLRGAVPLWSAKHAGVNAACRWWLVTHIKQQVINLEMLSVCSSILGEQKSLPLTM